MSVCRKKLEICCFFFYVHFSFLYFQWINSYVLEFEKVFIYDPINPIILAIITRSAQTTVVKYRLCGEFVDLWRHDWSATVGWSTRFATAILQSIHKWRERKENVCVCCGKISKKRKLFNSQPVLPLRLTVDGVCNMREPSTKKQIFSHQSPMLFLLSRMRQY